jgi:hypothetical protein
MLWQIYKSVDKQWPRGGTSQVRVDPTDENRVYAVTSTLFVSLDGGHNFKPISRKTHGDFHALWIDPKNPRRMWQNAGASRRGNHTNDASARSRNLSFFSFISGCPFGTANSTCCTATGIWSSSASAFGMLNTNPASSRRDRTASICSRLVAGVSCSSASGNRQLRNRCGLLQSRS